MNDPIEHATGIEKFELMAKASQQPTSGLGGSNEFEVSALVFLANGKSCLLILVCLTTFLLFLK